MTSKEQWASEQHWESDWWNGRRNTNFFAEEAKQITYLHRMGLPSGVGYGTWPEWNIEGKNVIDIGGGPTSALLKCVNRGPECIVVDPCEYPEWVHARYEYAGVKYLVAPAEELSTQSFGVEKFDEAWIYNVLQHTYDPEAIIRNAQAVARTIRIFEWVEAGVSPGHPQNLHPDKLNLWLGGIGTVEDMRGKPENGCDWIAYYGVFDGDS